MRQAAAALAALMFAAAASANTYTVTSTADSGVGTLRQAILDANAHIGADTISFNITGSGVQTITPASALPVISDPVTIDGYTQSGSSANTQPVGQGLNTVLTIELVGSLSVSASDTTIRGLVIHDGNVTFSNGASSNNKVEGCFLGTDPAGTQRIVAAFGTQVTVTGGSNATIGGSSPAARNLISVCGAGVTLAGGGTGHVIEGNLLGLAKTGDVLLTPACPGTTFAININGTGDSAIDNVIAGGSNGFSVNGSGHTFKGNFIGTDVTGTKRMEVYEHDFAVAATNCIIGGSAPGEGNVIAAANFYEGLLLGGSGHVVYGNFIGTDPIGTIDLGSNRIGIIVTGDDMTIGGVNPGEGNTIAFNGKTFGSGGVGISAQHVRVRGNRIYSNNGLGIDLPVGGNGGVTPNDPGDADSGPNGLQNYPILTSAGPALPQGSGTHITGILNSTPATTFDLDFYSNPACAPRPQEFLEGQDYIGSHQVTTDGSGNAGFDITLPFTVEANARITATATDPNGNTSEFSQRLIFSMSPTTGSPAGGTNITISGMLFEAGATVTVGGTPATNVNVTGPAQITATTPARPAGSLNNVVVTNTDETGGMLANGWIADFTDVPSNQQFYYYIGKLVANQITVGCGSGNYCPVDSVTRQQMAVFLMKSINGLCYVPPPCTGVFPDVPCSSNFAKWIEALAASGITGGCGGGNYCPTNAVTRQQMAVFLLKAKHGSTYVPPACDGDFLDVPCPSQFADWIEQLAAEGITGGCGNGNYCPGNPVRRDQMAAFLFNTFQFP
jgi:nitrogen fixation protein